MTSTPPPPDAFCMMPPPSSSFRSPSPYESSFPTSYAPPTPSTPSSSFPSPPACEPFFPMSQISLTASTSPSNFQSVFCAALERYEKKTRKKLLTHPLAAQLQSCDSPTEILTLLQGLVHQFDHRRRDNERLTNWLSPTVNVLYVFSAILGEGVGLVLSPAKSIFAGIGVLLLTAKDVEASQDVLIDIFDRIENFFKRLEFYTTRNVSPTITMTDVIVKIMVEVLSILAIATKEIKRGRAKKYAMRLLGKNDIENALKRLDTLTQEEARLMTAEVWEVAQSVDDKVKVVIDDGRETKEVIQQAASEARVAMQQSANDTKMIMQHTERTAATVNHFSREQFRQDLRKWLSPPDPSTSHNAARRAQHEGTTTWFFQGCTYNQWKSTASLLWIYGKPGSGKSILCSALIEDMMALRKAGSASTAYFYCDFRDENKQSYRNLILSILFQLSTQSDVCFDTLSHLYSEHENGAQKPSDSALILCLKEVLSLSTQRPIYLVVDALDECPNNSGLPAPREQVLNLVKDLVDLRLANLHICVTSRPEIDIRNTLEPLASLRISLHDQNGQKKDIVDYVSSVVYSDTKMQRWREEDRRLVITKLSENADGMFRWVYCQLEALRHCLPPSVRVTLDELPETLDDTYERILRGINKANREHAHRLLQCLTVANRPLRVEELAEVLAVEFDADLDSGLPKLNPDWRWADQPQAVLSTCSSLIAIVDDGYSQVVQFSHFSVKEFLTSDRLAHSSEDVSLYHIRLGPAHTILAQACLGVLLSLRGRVTRGHSRDSPLSRYAAQHWVNHAQFEDVSSRILHVMEYFFDSDKPHWAAWLRVYDIDKSWNFFAPRRVIGDVVPLYYAALCGLYDLAERLIVKNPAHVNAIGGQMSSPLVAALHGKQFRVAELLYRHGADVDVRSRWKGTPLHAASYHGVPDMAQWLLDHGADVNAEDKDCWVPLYLAARDGHFQICRILLEHNVNVNARNSWGEVPLHRAASPTHHRDQLNIMRLLLEHGADVNARDDDGSTPLHHSSWQKRGGIATKGTVKGSRLLLQHGAKLDAKNNEGKTALQVALEAGHLEMVEFLSGLDAK
ncbi:hypothetical protein BC826DRAFT_951451 [Russula brevipes]|nr:hypothetical protein BC826DRAFT_951451 [Russula brevipes]